LAPGRQWFGSAVSRDHNAMQSESAVPFTGVDFDSIPVSWISMVIWLYTKLYKTGLWVKTWVPKKLMVKNMGP
jgi:hypothetical protein